MKILFSPSETKNSGGESKPFDENSFLFKELYSLRLEVVNKYQEYINSASLDEKKKLFGIKDEELIFEYSKEIKIKPTMKAIDRYSGVAFDYLDYNSLDNNCKDYIDNNLLIFSNIFGILRAGDCIPEYKLKQGEKIAGFCIEKYYFDNFSKEIDNYLEDEDIIDLRAGFYQKFYKIKKNYTTMKFIKDNKVVSHWAKAYRGIVLREIAKKEIKTIDEFMNLEILNLKVQEIKKVNNSTEIIFNIIK